MQSKSLRTDDSCREDIEKYSDMVYRLAYSLVKNGYDADDIYQDVFWKYIQKKPVFKSEEHKKAWFLRVTINRCKNFWKTAWMLKVIGAHPDAGMEENNAAEYAVPSAEEVFFESRQNELIETVKKLPPKYRMVIHLFYYEDMSVEEISSILKQKPSTVRTQLTRARAVLRDNFKEEI